MGEKSKRDTGCITMLKSVSMDLFSYAKPFSIKKNQMQLQESALVCNSLTSVCLADYSGLCFGIHNGLFLGDPFWHTIKGK